MWCARLRFVWRGLEKRVEGTTWPSEAPAVCKRLAGFKLGCQKVACMTVCKWWGDSVAHLHTAHDVLLARPGTWQGTRWHTFARPRHMRA